MCGKDIGIVGASGLYPTSNPTLDRTLLKRQDAIRAIVMTCVILAGLVVLVPAKAPAVGPMDVIVTTWRSTIIPYAGGYNLTFTFTFTNITTYVVSTVISYTTTVSIPTFTTFRVNTTIPTSITTTVTTYRTTRTIGTTTVPSTSTIWTTAAATTTNRTITTTASETVTSTSYTTTSITSTSTYTVTGATPPTPPPIPGFPLESILAGLALGLLGVHLIYRNRRANRKHQS